MRTTPNLEPQASVTVQQLTCAEPDCPPIETKIVVLGLESKRWTVHEPVSEVDHDTVRNSLTTRPGGDSA